MSFEYPQQFCQIRNKSAEPVANLSEPITNLRELVTFLPCVANHPRTVAIPQMHILIIIIVKNIIIIAIIIIITIINIIITTISSYYYFYRFLQTSPETWSCNYSISCPQLHLEETDTKPFTGLMELKHVTLSWTVAHQSWLLRSSIRAPEFSPSN